MGRRPNPLILEYFARGPKLNDNSNRYPHTCKQCGENFPKGRLDSLTAHITKKCPAISDSDRMRVCLELHGLKHQAALAAQERNSDARRNGLTAAGISSLPQGWSALETLAEASRQVDLNEHNRGQKQPDGTTANPTGATIEEGQIGAPGTAGSDQVRFELQEQFTLDNPPTTYQGHQDADKDPTTASTPGPPETMTPEERLQALLPATQSPPDPSNISVAVAATARLSNQLLDPQLVSAESAEDIPTATSASLTQNTAAAVEMPQEVQFQSAAETAPLQPDSSTSQPWGEMTYHLTQTNPIPVMTDNAFAQFPLTRGGTRMDTSDGLLNGRPKHARSRFTPSRRREVQEVRKIGACIRCRILRKNCGKGTPCDTCRKVLSPRVWRTGCVRTRLNEQLDLYSAGVQVVLSQNRVNHMRDTLQLESNDTVLEVSHFPEAATHIELLALSAAIDATEEEDDSSEARSIHPRQTIMIDQDTQDVSGKIDTYMREVFPLFVQREPSNFVRTTLDTAMEQLSAGGEDELLSKALELWGLVESIDRERQWSIVETTYEPSTMAGTPDQEKVQRREQIKETHKPGGQDVYGMICMQLNAAAERRANNTSRQLLNLMDRLLTDSKTKISFNMFLTAIVFLNCVEKSTWAFKAWEQDHLRPGWPLERDPSIFTQQGENLAGLLRMLLSIRKALPITARSADGRLVTQEEDAMIVDYFQRIDLDFETIEARQKGSQFNPADSRSLELMFCSHLLLPSTP